MIHAWRGGASRVARSPIWRATSPAFSSALIFSDTVTSRFHSATRCPPRSSRRAMLPPMRPSPSIAMSMVILLLEYLTCVIGRKIPDLRHTRIADEANAPHAAERASIGVAQQPQGFFQSGQQFLFVGVIGGREGHGDLSGAAALQPGLQPCQHGE